VDKAYGLGLEGLGLGLVLGLKILASTTSLSVTCFVDEHDDVVFRFILSFRAARLPVVGFYSTDL